MGILPQDSEDRGIGFYLAAAFVGAIGLCAFAFGLLAFADTEFGILPFGDLTVRKVTGGWLDFWRWFLGVVSGLACAFAYHWIERESDLSVIVRVPLALVYGAGIVAFSTVAVFVLLIVAFFVFGIIAMLFAGPF